MSIPTPQTRTTAQYFLQSVLAFAVSTIGVAVGIVYLPVDLWMRAFLGMSVLFVITATFTLAKCVRDRQEDALAAEQAQYYQQLPIWNGADQQPAQRS
ncbi:YiaA/YiaB family inner membrane protein [Nocardiopsis sp. YSL2]|uniref:YiaA/YiaB family inner membrane protein n=1 Tax=Nocardiopsis sp. YSL2 TaxID=2939492 RepID=UPI0026F4467D|nr:YiaA/YiaB family inner membrane protein [Nocardiopsis sp. YSL2]